MQGAVVSAACVMLLLLSSRSATQLAPVYAVVAALPLIRNATMALVAAVAVALAASWHPFDLISATVSALIAASATSLSTATVQPTVAAPTRV